MAKQNPLCVFSETWEIVHCPNSPHFLNMWKNCIWENQLLRRGKLTWLRWRHIFGTAGWSVLFFVLFFLLLKKNLIVVITGESVLCRLALLGWFFWSWVWIQVEHSTAQVSVLLISGMQIPLPPPRAYPHFRSTGPLLWVSSSCIRSLCKLSHWEGDETSRKMLYLVFFLRLKQEKCVI